MLKKGSISMSREFMEKNSDSVQRQKDQGKPWAERNGAWIFLVLVIGGDRFACPLRAIVPIGVYPDRAFPLQSHISQICGSLTAGRVLSVRPPVVWQSAMCGCTFSTRCRIRAAGLTWHIRSSFHRLVQITHMVTARKEYAIASFIVHLRQCVRLISYHVSKMKRYDNVQ